MAGLLPEDIDKEALKTTEMWRLFYLWFPGSLFTIMLFALTFTIKYDSIKNLIITGNIEEAKLFA